MKKLTVLVLALIATPSLALASVQGPSLSARPQASIAGPIEASAPADGTVRMEVSQTTIPAGEALPEHRNPTLRYIYVVSGRVRVSNLVTGVEQDVNPGEMAVETEGHWHVAKALDGLPADILLIDGAALGQIQP